MEKLLTNYEWKQIALALHLGYIDLDIIKRIESIDENNMSQADEEFINEVEDQMDDCDRAESDSYNILTEEESDDELKELLEEKMDIISDLLDNIWTDVRHYFDFKQYQDDQDKLDWLWDYEEVMVDNILYLIFKK